MCATRKTSLKQGQNKHWSGWWGGNAFGGRSFARRLVPQIVHLKTISLRCSLTSFTIIWCQTSSSCLSSMCGELYRLSMVQRVPGMQRSNCKLAIPNYKYSDWLWHDTPALCCLPEITTGSLRASRSLSWNIPNHYTTTQNMYNSRKRHSTNMPTKANTEHNYSILERQDKNHVISIRTCLEPGYWTLTLEKSLDFLYWYAGVFIKFWNCSLPREGRLQPMYLSYDLRPTSINPTSDEYGLWCQIIISYYICVWYKLIFWQRKA